MVKKVSLLLLMVLLLVVSPLIGCSNSNGGVTNPIGLVPKKANVIGHVDLSKILQDNDLTGIYDKVPKDSSYPQTFDDALAKLKEAHKLQDIDGIDKATAELNMVFQAASEEMYRQGQQAGPQPGAGQQDPGMGSDHGAGKGKDSEVTDVDFEEVK